MSKDKSYVEATEFVEYWFGQANSMPKSDTEQVAVRAALDQNPQLVQTVKRQLKLLLADPSFPAWAKRVRYTDDHEEVRQWVVKVIRGLTAGLRLRDQTGRIESSRPFEPPTTSRRRGWPERTRRRRDP
jgi:hypothetical protein